jgi:hypothetical protein
MITVYLLKNDQQQVREAVMVNPKNGEAMLKPVVCIQAGH